MQQSVRVFWSCVENKSCAIKSQGLTTRLRGNNSIARDQIVAAGGKHAKVPADATAAATVGIGPREPKGFGLTVQLYVTLPGVDRAAAEALVHEAHEVCPYSNATRGNIDVVLNVV